MFLWLFTGSAKIMVLLKEMKQNYLNRGVVEINKLMNKINAYLCSIFSAVNFKLSCSRLLSTIKLFQDLAEFI